MGDVWKGEGDLVLNTLTSDEFNLIEASKIDGGRVLHSMAI
ncbi:MAG: hypothetical protein RXR43_13155 [Sulfolobus sp.]